MKNYIAQLLTDFINDKSDNSPMEASEQERFEKGFEEYLDRRPVEQEIIEQLHEMAEKSLPPNIHNYYIIAIKTLCENNKKLVVEKELQSEYDASINSIQSDGLNVLKILMMDSGTTPDRDDVMNVVGI